MLKLIYKKEREETSNEKKPKESNYFNITICNLIAYFKHHK